MTQSGLDYLAVGQELSDLPSNIISVDWPSSVYQNPLVVRFENDDGETVEMQLLDLDLSIDRDATTEEASACRRFPSMSPSSEQPRTRHLWASARHGGIAPDFGPAPWFDFSLFKFANQEGYNP